VGLDGGYYRLAFQSVGYSSMSEFQSVERQVKVYNAGSGDYGRNIDNVKVCKHRLHSFACVNKNNVQCDLEAGVEVALDSGAYTAWRQGTPIVIDDYIEYLHANKEKFSWFANLDIIRDPVGTLDNQRIMERAGLFPVPCFHRYEDLSFLRKYIDKYEYIALGGMMGGGNQSGSQAYFDSVFDLVCGDNGIPRVKIHGFGVTRSELMARYPWYSVDSSAWVQNSSFGKILVPRKRKGHGFDFTGAPWVVEVYSSPLWRRRNISNLTPNARRIVIDFLDSEKIPLGKTEWVWHKHGTPYPQDWELSEEDMNENRPVNKDEGHALVRREVRNGKVHVPLIVERGVCNNVVFRQIAIARYFDRVGDCYPYPQPFLHKAKSGRRFFV